jgi:hypothetical protein
VGYVKELRKGWRWGCFGNDTLIAINAVLDAGLSEQEKENAREILTKWGDNGKPFASEFDRIRAGLTEGSA